MSLLSQLFSGDLNLLAAATKDSGHITMGASGAHVAKIQEALNRIDNAKLDVDSKYGQKTAAAVVNFKSKRNIRNSAGAIDNIVGIKTMAALDGLLLKKVGDGPAPAPGPSSFSGGQVIIDPMIDTVTLTQVSTDLNKSDLNDQDPPSPALTFAQKAALAELALDNQFMLEARMQAELLGMAQGLGLDMFNRFKTNRQRAFRMEFRRGSMLQAAVLIGTDIRNVHRDIQLELDKLLKAQFAAGRVNINALAASVPGDMQGNRKTLTNPNGIKTSPVVDVNKSSFPLLAVIGQAFGGGVVTVLSFSADQTGYKGILTYELIDHFGVDNSDILFDRFHGTAGQKAFWLLQHKHGPGFKPYVTTVIFDFEFSGKF